MKIKQIVEFCASLVVSISSVLVILPSNVHAYVTTTTNGKIVFRSDRDGNDEIYTMNADGSSLTRLTNNAASDGAPSWSPDGTKIAFRSDRDGDYEIYTMNVDGSAQTNVSNNVAVETGPSWSPDGTKIVFTTGRDGNNEIYTMNSDGSSQVNISNNASGEGNPSWSPDGTKIVFTTGRDGNDEIYTMNADGSSQTNISNNAGDELYPSWSPDGTKIVFRSDRDSGNDEIYTMNADGTVQTNLSNNAGEDFLPSWSPDGTKIAFVTTRDGNYETYTMNADGTVQTNLSNNAAEDNVGSGYWLGITTISPETSTDGGGVITTVVNTGEDLSTVDYTIVDQETLSVNGTGQLGNVIIQDGGTLKGTSGTVGTITVNNGGKVAPGASPGCINSGNVSFVSGSSLDVEIGGTTVCTQYDQLDVTGTVDVTGATLNVAAFGGFIPTVGNTFTIVNNDGAEAITGAFTGRAQASTFTVGTVTYSISYTGGSGNDIVLTVTAVTAPVIPPTTTTPPATTAPSTAPTTTPTTPSTGFGAFVSNPLTVVLTTTSLAGAILAITRKYNLLRG